MEPPSLPPPPILRIERAVAPISFPDPALEKALQGVLFPSGEGAAACQRQGGARYVFNRFDLDGDRQPETLVALLGQPGCGPRGCPLLLLKQVGESLVPLQTIPGLGASLVVSQQRSQGWSDLILLPADGAIDPSPRRLIHNGAGYVSLSEPREAVGRDLPPRGVAALVLKQSPYLVQGHLLPCPRPNRAQRNRVLSREPNAWPSSSPPLVPLLPLVVEGGASRPAVWVATRLMSAQRKIPVAPWLTWVTGQVEPKSSAMLTVPLRLVNT